MVTINRYNNKPFPEYRQNCEYIVNRTTIAITIIRRRIRFQQLQELSDDCSRTP